MWKPILLVGAGVGAFLLYKKMSEDKDSTLPPGTPDPPEPPPGVINLSWNAAKSFAAGAPDDAELVWVHCVAVSAEHPDRNYGSVQTFTSDAAANTYIDTMTRFFDDNHRWWTCTSDGVGEGTVELWAIGFSTHSPRLPEEFARRTWSCERGKLVSTKSSLAPTPPAPVGALDKPSYVVMYGIESDTEASRSFVFSTEAEAKVYYGLLKAFFSMPLVRKAYTYPDGSVFLARYGTPPATEEHVAWDQDGELRV